MGTADIDAIFKALSRRLPGMISEALGKQQSQQALPIAGLTALWAVVYAGFMQIIALKTRSAAATNSAGLVFFPLLFLTPNFVPFERLSSVMETLARINPISYVIVGLRSLIIDGWDAGKILVCVAVIAVMGLILTALSLRTIATYDR